MPELHELTALEQGAAVRRREVSPTDLVEHYLDRIQRYSEALGAFITVTTEEARTRARAAEAELVGDGPVGPLYGVPIAVKDLTLTAGVRTTFGSAAFVDYIPPVDADVVRLMHGAGLISLGKTTTSEFGCSLYAEPAIAPPARNPWLPECTAGGSSGGAAAAVSAGLVPLAQGNDGGGSIRIPAAICGLVGFKPSRGVVSGGPFGFGGFGLATNGPLARTVADAAALLDAMADPVPGEPYPVPARPAAGFLDAALRPEAYLPSDRPLRVGRYAQPMLAEVAPEPGVLDAWTTASAALAAIGCEVVEVPGPFAPEAAPLFEVVWRILALAGPVPPDREHLLLPLTRWLRGRGREIGVETLLAALSEMQNQVRAAAARYADCDLLLSPVTARAQAPIGWFTEPGDPAVDFARQKDFSPYCAAYNVTGQPAVSLPFGWTRAGAPVGAMLAARLGDDHLLIAVAAALQQAGAWPERHSAMWAREYPGPGPAGTGR